MEMQSERSGMITADPRLAQVLNYSRVSIAAMAAPPAPDPSDPARLVALADRCVQCGLCLPHCPTYRLDRSEAESPRGRIAYIKATASGQLAPTAPGDIHLDHCLGCRRCEAACPAGVDYGSLLIGARARQAERSSAPLGLRLAQLALARPSLLGAALPLARLAGRLPTLPTLPTPVDFPTREASPTARGRVKVFVGCIASAYEKTTRVALGALLRAAGFEANIPTGQNCCGTAAAHAGDLKTAQQLADDNRRVFDGGTVLSLASGCQEGLAHSLSGLADVRDAVEFLDAEGSALRFRSANRRVALHLPCTQRVLKSDAALRRLLARIPALDLVELPDTGCCGAAGLHMLAEPERAAALRAPLLAALAASGASELLSANIGCRLHLALGAKLPVRHPLDLLAEYLA